MHAQQLRRILLGVKILPLVAVLAVAACGGLKVGDMKTVQWKDIQTDGHGHVTCYRVAYYVPGNHLHATCVSKTVYGQTTVGGQLPQ